MRIIHHLLFVLGAAALLMPAISTAASGGAALANHVWIHGSEDCSKSNDPAIETFKFDEDTYILRQSKCVDFEAPFIYVLFGSHTVLVQDTGATPKENLDVFFKLPRKSDLPLHWHTSAERMVLVSGKLHVTYQGQSETVLRPGTYAYGPAKRPHHGRCASA